MRRSGLTAAVAGLLVAGLCVVPRGAAFADADPGMSIAPMPVMAVSLAQAGEIVQWPAAPTSASPMADVPASLSGVAVTQVALAASTGFAVTASGRLVSWGGDQARLQNIPADVAAAPVAQVATNISSYAGVVTRAGTVKTWGIKRAFETPLDVPQGLTDVKQLAFANQRAFALRNNGTVVAWGQGNSNDPSEPPGGLQATALAVTNSQAFALTTNDTVVGWDKDGPLNLPDQLEEPGNVRAIARAGYSGVLAILADGSLFTWGTTNAPDAAVGSDPVAIVGSGNYFAVVDDDGAIHHWNVNQAAAVPPFVESGLVPVGLNGRAISQLALSYYGAGAAIVTKMLRGDDPTISGTPNPGQTLTGTPGTFSGSPEGMSVTNRWLADGTPIANASGATLTLTNAMLGKKITYQSTATKAGETISSTSAAVTVSKPAPPVVTKVGSKTKIGKVKVAKKATKVIVPAKVIASKSPAGKAKVTIAKGKKKIVAKNVKVNAKGAVKLAVKKFNKLVAKKTKAKGKKAKRAHRGKYQVVVNYLGNGSVKPSKASKKFKVK